MNLQRLFSSARQQRNTEIKGINAFALECNLTTEDKSMWILDSSATNHICNSLPSFDSYIQFEKPIEVKLENATTMLDLGREHYN